MAKKLAETIRKTKPTVDPEQAEKEFREFVESVGWSMRHISRMLPLSWAGFEGAMARGFYELEADLLEQTFQEIGLKLLNFKMPEGMKYYSRKHGPSGLDSTAAYKDRLEAQRK